MANMKMNSQIVNSETQRETLSRRMKTLLILSNKASINELKPLNTHHLLHGKKVLQLKLKKLSYHY